MTVGTGSTWAMRATLVLAMSGLEWQELVFDLEDAKALARLKRVGPAGLVPSGVMHSTPAVDAGSANLGAETSGGEHGA